jgi:hypothetical protein
MIMHHCILRKNTDKHVRKQFKKHATGQFLVADGIHFHPLRAFPTVSQVLAVLHIWDTKQKQKITFHGPRENNIYNSQY